MIPENEILEKTIKSFPFIIISVDGKRQICYANQHAKDFLANLTTNPYHITIDQVFPILESEELPWEWNKARILKNAELDFVALAEKIASEDYPDWTILILFPLHIFESITGEALIMKKELEQIIDCSYDEIFITDGSGYVLRLSAGACRRLYGVEPEEIIGRNVKELETEGYFSPSVFEQVIQEKRRITTIQSNKMGQKTIVTANPLFDDEGKIIRVVSNSRDITEFINLSEQIQKSEKKVQRFYKKLVKIKQDVKAMEGFVAESPKMRSVVDMAHRVANFDSTVLLLGESGVGKDFIAKLIHNLGPRSDGSFQKINCGAIPDNLLESELFGYAPGAFTGALKEGKQGLIEEAGGGTLYLDEIAEMPYYLQVKLLQVIEEKIVTRVGSSKPKPVDIRIIAATNKNLKEMIAQKKFREDLYYRLNVISLYLPPLRERPEDLEALCSLFIGRFNQNFNTSKMISPEAMNIMRKYSWPGNVRELENFIERFLVMSDEDLMLPEDLPEYIVNQVAREEKEISSFSETEYLSTQARLSKYAINSISEEEIGHPDEKAADCFPGRQEGVKEPLPLEKVVKKAEIEAIITAFKKYDRTNRAADALGISQSTLIRRLKKYGIKLDHAKLTLPKQ